MVQFSIGKTKQFNTALYFRNFSLLLFNTKYIEFKIIFCDNAFMLIYSNEAVLVVA